MPAMEKQSMKDDREKLELELADLACAIDAADDHHDLKECQRLTALFDEAFMRLAKNELAQGQERPTTEDINRVMSTYERRRRERSLS
jgi:hypothetical protein